MYQPMNYNYTKQQVIRVNGENGAKAYLMPPDSSALLLDESAPLVWLTQTDGAGYKTVSAYKIEPYVPEPQPDMVTLLKKINELEERLSEQSNFRHDKSAESNIGNSKKSN